MIPCQKQMGDKVVKKVRKIKKPVPSDEDTASEPETSTPRPKKRKRPIKDVSSESGSDEEDAEKAETVSSDDQFEQVNTDLDETSEASD